MDNADTIVPLAHPRRRSAIRQRRRSREAHQHHTSTRHVSCHSSSVQSWTSMSSDCVRRGGTCVGGAIPFRSAI